MHYGVKWNSKWCHLFSHEFYFNFPSFFFSGVGTKCQYDSHCIENAFCRHQLLCICKKEFRVISEDNWSCHGMKNFLFCFIIIKTMITNVVQNNKMTCFISTLKTTKISVKFYFIDYRLSVRPISRHIKMFTTAINLKFEA